MMGQAITTTTVSVGNGHIIAARAVPEEWTTGLMYWQDSQWEHVTPPAAARKPRAVKPLATVTYGPFLLTPVWQFRRDAYRHDINASFLGYRVTFAEGGHGWHHTLIPSLPDARAFALDQAGAFNGIAPTTVLP